MVFQISKLDDRLLQWKSTLPPHLSCYISKPVEPLDLVDPYSRQAVVICLTYLNSVVLVHRPYLISEISRTVLFDEFYTPLEKRTEISMVVARGSVRACIQSSIEVINTIRGHESTSPLAGWWYTVYYTFQAAVVLLAAVILAHRTGVAYTGIDVTIEVVLYQVHVDKSIEVLGHLAVEFPIAKRCQIGLRRLLFKVRQHITDANPADNTLLNEHLKTAPNNTGYHNTAQEDNIDMNIDFQEFSADQLLSDLLPYIGFSVSR